MTHQQRTAPGPRTAAGLAMLNDPRSWWVQKHDLTEMILAIEAEAAEQSVPLDVEALRDPLTKWTHRWWCRPGPLGKRPPHRMPPCGEMVDDFLAEYARLVPARPADTALRLLRGMVQSWDRMDPTVRGTGWPHEAWINETKRFLAAQPTSAEEET